MDELEKSFNPEDMTDLYTLYKSDLDYIKVLKQNANNIFLKDNSGGGGGEGGDITASQITDSTATGRSVLTAANAAAARTAIGAGTGSSNLAIGNTSTTAKRGDYQPLAADISDSSEIGRFVLTAIDAEAARTAIGAVTIGTTANTAKAGNYTPPVATASTAGLVKLATDTIQTITPTAVSATTARTYMVQPNPAGQMVVNVPWVNTTYTLPAATASTIGGVKTAAAPTITITDPVDDENVQAAFDSLILALKTAGVLT